MERHHANRDFSKLFKLGLGVGLFLAGAQSLQASPSSAFPNLMDAFSKAMLSTSSLSKTKFAGLRLIVGAQKPAHEGDESDKLRVNFEDNRLDLLTESVIFSNGSYGEFDSSTGVSLEPVQAGSFCMMKAKRGPLEAGPLSNAQLRALPQDWIFPEGDIWKVDPYTPAAMRTQDLGENILLRFEMVPPSGNVVRNEVRIDELLCQVHVKDLENAESGLRATLQSVLGPWLNFSVRSSN
ncbi:MAG: hypothetical protein ABIR96_11050 [Bdellovibrionota bacterium]